MHIKEFLKSPINVFALIILLSLGLDRIIFDRDLYADGACHFIQAFFVSEVDFPLKSRILGTALLHIPFSIFSSLGVKDYDALRWLWKVGYVAPFIISFVVILFLEKPIKDFGIAILSLSITLFYLPNSMFAVGEYTMIFAILPIMLAASKEYLDFGSFKSSVIFCSSALILSTTYEAGALFAIIFTATLLIILAIKGRSKNLLVNIREQAPLLFVFIGVIFFTFVGFKFMPDWLKANAGYGMKEYLVMIKWGAFSDTFIFYQIAVVSVFLGATKIADFKVERKIILMSIVFLVCLESLFANHQPRHSYYSKSLFVPLYFIFIYYLLLFRIEITTILKLSMVICFPSFMAVFLYTFIQGYEFNSYLGSLKNILNQQSSNTYKNYTKIDYLKSGLGEKYTWSWGHACVSLILKPDNNAMIIGEFDKDYPYPEVKKIINSKINSDK